VRHVPAEEATLTHSTNDEAANAVATGSLCMIKESRKETKAVMDELRIADAEHERTKP